MFSPGTHADDVNAPPTPSNLLVLGLQGLVRKKGFEPSRSCERQPLKLVRSIVLTTDVEACTSLTGCSYCYLPQ